MLPPRRANSVSSDTSAMFDAETLLLDREVDSSSRMSGSFLVLANYISVTHNSAAYAVTDAVKHVESVIKDGISARYKMWQAFEIQKRQLEVSRRTLELQSKMEDKMLKGVSNLRMSFHGSVDNILDSPFMMIKHYYEEEVKAYIVIPNFVDKGHEDD